MLANVEFSVRYFIYLYIHTHTNTYIHKYIIIGKFWCLIFNYSYLGAALGTRNVNGR